MDIFMLVFDGAIDLTLKYVQCVKADIQNEYTLYNYIKDTKKYYPSFDIWYFMNVIPSLKDGRKKIIISHDNNNLKGLAILKYNEKKLCHLSVMPPYKNKGYGIKLFKQSFIELETEKPFLTVSEEKLIEFKKVFDYFGFELTDIIDGYYRKDKKEYFYNQI
jgi:acetyltransferase, GNAT family